MTREVTSDSIRFGRVGSGQGGQPGDEAAWDEAAWDEEMWDAEVEDEREEDDMGSSVRCRAIGPIVIGEPSPVRSTADIENDPTQAG
ncbi:MAG: hypothetical protein R2733_09225 [Acidimicrobiales bacterium]